jgi:hypothetical protein
MGYIFVAVRMPDLDRRVHLGSDRRSGLGPKLALRPGNNLASAAVESSSNIERYRLNSEIDSA